MGFSALREAIINAFVHNDFTNEVPPKFEQLGSGVPRIPESYGKDCFTFSDHFLRMSFPVSGGQGGGQEEKTN